MANFVARACMGVLVRIEVGTSSQTAITKVTVLVDMEAVLLARVEATEVTCNESAGKRVGLLKPDDSSSSLTRLRVHDTNGSAWLRL